MNNTVKKQQGIKWIALSFFVIVIGGGIILINKQSKIKELSSKNAELGSVLHVRDSVVSDLISAFDTIENNLTFINQRRSQLVIENMEKGRSQKESLINDIKMMNTMLEESSAKINELEQKLNKSGVELKSFKNKIAALSKKIELQNQQIEDFKFQIEEQNEQLAMFKSRNEDLQNRVITVRDSVKLKQEIVDQKEEIIVQKVNELNKGFFAMGTYKELFANGLVFKEGGLLGIGKSKTLKNNFNDEYFTPINITEDKVIPLNARKVNLISDHPVNSYRLVEENGLITQLEIEVPEDFWKISHYAVIEVKL